MPRNFDDVLPQDRTFEVRGEKFSFVDVRPEVISAWESSTNGKDDTSVWEQQDSQILLFVDSDQHERWLELRKREKDPVTIAQQNAVLTWLFEVATGRPTNPESPSPSGHGKTGA